MKRNKILFGYILAIPLVTLLLIITRPAVAEDDPCPLPEPMPENPGWVSGGSWNEPVFCFSMEWGISCIAESEYRSACPGRFTDPVLPPYPGPAEVITPEPYPGVETGIIGESVFMTAEDLAFDPTATATRMTIPKPTNRRGRP